MTDPRLLADMVEMGDSNVIYDPTTRDEIAAALRLSAGIEGLMARIAAIAAEGDVRTLYKIASSTHELARHAQERAAARPFKAGDAVTVSRDALPRRIRGAYATVVAVDGGMTKIATTWPVREELSVETRCLRRW